MTFVAGQALTAGALNELVLTDTWHDLTPLQNLWVVGVQPQYRKDPHGVVHFRGRISNGTTTVGTLIATLPVGYRTPVTGGHRFVCSNGASSTTYGSIQVEPDGDLVVAITPGTASFNLDGIQYATT